MMNIYFIAVVTFAAVSTIESVINHYNKVQTCLDPSISHSQEAVSSLIACAVKCSADGYCRAFTFRLSGTCYLHRSFLSTTGCSDEKVKHYNSVDGEVCLNGGLYDDVTKQCRCVNSYVGDRCERFMEDCIEGQDSGHYAGVKGVFTIHPKLSAHPFQVYCEMGVGKLFIMYRKINEPYVNFKRGWDEYRDGFGNILEKNFWLGLEKMYLITSSRKHRLVVTGYFADNPPNHRQHYYEDFTISSGSNGYSFTSSAHSANDANGGQHELYDCLWDLQGQPFSTMDNDNEHCAITRMSGWWFKNCSKCNPTGELQPRTDSFVPADPKIMSWPMPGDYAVKSLLMFLKKPK